MMHIHFRDVVVLIFVFWLNLAAARSCDSSHYPAQDVITRDFCIIGGGSSGTYAAIRLHDMGKSVVVVEQKDRLGGHTETYIDPTTQIPTDIGVVVLNNLDVVKSYLTRLNVEYVIEKPPSGTPTEYVDMSTGKLLSTYAPPDPTAALGAYYAQLSKYPYLVDGFDLPSPVPEDLLLPFGQFVTKYSLQNVVQTVASIAQGVGNLLDAPTLYVIKVFGLDMLATLQIGFINTKSNNKSEIYQKATTILGSDVLLSSSVMATYRGSTDGYVKVVVKTSNSVKLIQAKKLIISIPPKLNNLVGFDLSAQETSLFSQFENSAYYTGLLHNSGIDPTLTILNAGETTTYNLPKLPGPYGFYPTAVRGLTHVWYGVPSQLSDEQVKSDIISRVQRFQQQNNMSTTTPSFATFSGHVPFGLTVSTSAIAGGFYRDLYALQGQRQTFYTGAAFHAHDSAQLWRFTEALLPTITGSLVPAQVLHDSN